MCIMWIGAICTYVLTHPLRSSPHLLDEKSRTGGLDYMVRLNQGGDVLSDIKLHLVITGLQ